jgi:MFS family permease
VSDLRAIRPVIIASFIGTAIEWYDFFLCGTAAALVFNRLFFPTVDPMVGTLSAFGTFAVGFVARPIGGIVFGHYGDSSLASCWATTPCMVLRRHTSRSCSGRAFTTRAPR